MRMSKSCNIYLNLDGDKVHYSDKRAEVLLWALVGNLAAEPGAWGVAANGCHHFYPCKKLRFDAKQL